MVTADIWAWVIIRYFGLGEGWVKFGLGREVFAEILEVDPFLYQYFWKIGTLTNKETFLNQPYLYYIFIQSKGYLILNIKMLIL